MENASKALIMAGSILISIIVIGLVVVSYNQIVSVQQTKNNADITSKMTKYAKMFEQYNTSIYGSELLSLGNLQEYYNNSQKDVQGYDEIKINVKIKNTIKENGKTYLSQGQHSLEEVKDGLDSLKAKIGEYEDDRNGYEYRKNGKTIKKSVKYYAQLSNRQIAILFGVPFTSDELDYDIGEKLADKDKTTNPDTVKLLKDIEIYKNLKTSYTGFKNKVFMCENTTYNEYNGRINFMNFTEN